ncbi:Uncharacterised protein [Pseudomonas putida]|uniref:hypothetical protein n=1 Tax=Pseudomonas asiatica TaxID=2219225 RepID=UPI0010C0683F|nr:hypothetical protein [Pseudomonas asiatica]CAB5605794.1 Uncharacterised protein [Pseudomonas putida]MBO2925521.1 hypothetical protein [Pseudomonas asiatica]WPU60199.1 hypothetical protein SQW15_26505 [Pseudomonas asiatica]CAB5641997.1 Uncharacterised protein [Pseudomonas putida]CAB5721349.1 Uncharacterised protein [Pseudomonas putida]
MTLVVNSLTCRSGTGIFWSARRVIRGLACGSGVVVTLLYLAGCAMKAEPENSYVRVEVPVQVPCRAPKVAVPAWAAAGLRKTDTLEVKVRALLAERRQRIGYEKELEAATMACR